MPRGAIAVAIAIALCRVLAGASCRGAEVWAVTAPTRRAVGLSGHLALFARCSPSCCTRGRSTCRDQPPARGRPWAGVWGETGAGFCCPLSRNLFSKENLFLLLRLVLLAPGAAVCPRRGVPGPFLPHGNPPLVKGRSSRRGGWKEPAAVPAAVEVVLGFVCLWLRWCLFSFLLSLLQL